LERRRILAGSLVAHGRNSGENRARSFSNTPESKKSSLGLYLTEEAYNGRHGYFLRLIGLENGINDNARRRVTVVHGADYVSEGFIARHGRIGRSWGCPALPIEKHRAIIEIIKDGTALFIHSKDRTLLGTSRYFDYEQAMNLLPSLPT